MKLKPIKWVIDRRQYSSGENAVIENIGIGSVHYDSLSSKDEAKKYKAHFELGLFQQPSNFATVEEAKKWVEAAFQKWFSKIVE